MIASETTSEIPNRVVDVESKSNLTIEIAGAAIFGALSIVVSLLTTENLPRMSWGIAYFDPVSLIWIAAFFIFGFRSGLLTCVIGMVGLMPFDPTPLVGPVMKFVATIWFVTIPYLVIKLMKKEKPTGDDIAKLKYYIPSMIIAWIFRCIAMVILNYLYIVYVWQVPMQFLDLSWLGHAEINGMTAVLITVVLLNTLQTLFDVSIPYLIVFKGGIYERTKYF
jgi:riboflavin transporter FmnP